MSRIIQKVIWPVRLVCLVIGGMWYLATGRMDDGRPERPDRKLDARLRTEAAKRKKYNL
jgi:hypothetical protein